MSPSAPIHLSQVCGRSVANAASRAAGLLLIEAAFATLLISVLFLALLGSFRLAADNVHRGQLSSRVGHLARSSLDVLLATDLSAPDLQVPGSQLESRTVSEWSAEGWRDVEELETGNLHLVRVVVVRLIGKNALADGRLDEADRVPGSTSPDTIAGRWISVTVVARGTPGRRVSLTLEALRVS